MGLRGWSILVANMLFGGATRPTAIEDKPGIPKDGSQSDGKLVANGSEGLIGWKERRRSTAGVVLHGMRRSSRSFVRWQSIMESSKPDCLTA